MMCLRPPPLIFNLNIRKLKGYKDFYRLKIRKYRILFYSTRTTRLLYY